MLPIVPMLDNGLLLAFARITRSKGTWHRTVESIEPVAFDTSHDVENGEAESTSCKRPEQATDWSCEECTKSAPIIPIKSSLQQNQIPSRIRVTLVKDKAEEKDSEYPAETSNHNLKTSPPVEPVREPQNEYRYQGRTNQITNKIDLQDIGTLQRYNNDRKDDDNNTTPNKPKIKPIAEDVVAARADHRALEAIKGGSAERDDHDKYNTDNPSGKLTKEEEEGEVTLVRGSERPGTRPGGEKTGATDEGEDYSYGNGRDDDADPEVFIAAGGEGAEPETGNEEVVRKNSDGEDVDELPS